MAYYDHRHSGIDETNILQVVKAVEGETNIILLKNSSEPFKSYVNPTWTILIVHRQNVERQNLDWDKRWNSKKR